MTERIVSNPSKPPFDRAAKKAQLKSAPQKVQRQSPNTMPLREAERAKTERLQEHCGWPKRRRTERRKSGDTP